MTMRDLLAAFILIWGLALPLDAPRAAPTAEDGHLNWMPCQLALTEEFPKTFNPDLIPKDLMEQTQSHFGHWALDLITRKAHDRSVPNLLGHSLELGRRMQAGDPHALTLIRLGAKVEKVPGGKLIVRLPRLGEFAKNYYEIMKGYVEAGIIRASDVIFPSTYYTNWHEFNRQNDFRAFRLGIDPVRVGADFLRRKPNDEIPHSRWTQLMARGFGIFQIGMADHDFAHFTEYVLYPKKMAAVRRLYKVLATGAIPQTPTKKVLELMRSDSDTTGRRAFLRIEILEEALSLPNLAKRNEIENLFPELFGSPDVPTLAGRRKKLDSERHNLSSFLERTQRIVTASEKLLLRMGGGLRDDYNFEKYVGETLRQSFGYSLKATRYETNEVFFSPLFTETLHFKLRRLQMATAQLTDIVANKRVLARTDQVEILTRFIAQNLATLEMAFYWAVRLEITPDLLVTDATMPSTLNTSQTGQYFSGYTEPGSLTHWAFLVSDSTPFIP